MTKLFVIFSLLFCVSGWAQDFRKLRPENSRDRIIIEGNQISLSWMRNYRNNDPKASTGELREALDFIISRASTVTLGVEKEGVVAEACLLGKDMKLMYDKNGEQKFNFARMGINGIPIIYICNVLLDTFSRDMNVIAEVITHEYYHFWEYSSGVTDDALNEENATSFEIGVTLHNLGCIPFATDYTEDVARKYGHKNYRACN